MTDRTDCLIRVADKSAAAKLAALQHIARHEFTALSAACPFQKSCGGTLLLGRHYALRPRGIVMLGINPGGIDPSFTVEPFEYNCLLVDSGKGSHAYWRNARTLFGSPSSLANAMDEATFSFCCPFRTPNWNGQPREVRDALVAHSRPILNQLINDCDPRLIIIAGVAGEALFRNLVSVGLDGERALPGNGDGSGTYQWRAYATTINDRLTTIAQVPHLSRANAKRRLAECGAWLAELVQTTSV